MSQPRLDFGTPVLGTVDTLGRLTSLVVSPVTGRVTHLVVPNADIPGTERLVPISCLNSTTKACIRTDLTRAAFVQLPRLREPDYIRPRQAMETDYGCLEPHWIWLKPFITPTPGYSLAFHERLPEGDVSIRRGDTVTDSSGNSIGRVDAFVIDPTDQAITHLVVQHGHLFGTRCVTIPLSDLADVTPQTANTGTRTVHLRSTYTEIADREDVSLSDWRRENSQ
jgi:sporulation protein YlmC with PRC-barrel domain